MASRPADLELQCDGAERTEEALATEFARLLQSASRVGRGLLGGPSLLSIGARRRGRGATAELKWPLFADARHANGRENRGEEKRKKGREGMGQERWLNLDSAAAALQIQSLRQAVKAYNVLVVYFAAHWIVFAKMPNFPPRHA